ADLAVVAVLVCTAVPSTVGWFEVGSSGCSPGSRPPLLSEPRDGGGYEAWQQSGTWDDSQAELIEQHERVHLEPVLGGLPVDHPADLKAGEADLATGRRQSAEAPGVRPGEQNPLRVHRVIGHGVLHLEVQIGESLKK